MEPVEVTVTFEAKRKNVFGATEYHWSVEFTATGRDLVEATGKAVKQLSTYVSKEDMKDAR